ncbi:MAG: hypothetical protein NVS3B9_4070 [Candidatus Doudnabacteria bacterium]
MSENRENKPQIEDYKEGVFVDKNKTPEENRRITENIREAMTLKKVQPDVQERAAMEKESAYDFKQRLTADLQEQFFDFVENADKSFVETYSVQLSRHIKQKYWGVRKELTAKILMDIGEGNKNPNVRAMAKRALGIVEDADVQETKRSKAA